MNLELFETIRCDDGKPRHLSWHQERMDRASKTRRARFNLEAYISERLRDYGPMAGRWKLRLNYTIDTVSGIVSPGECLAQAYTPNTVKALVLVDLACLRNMNVYDHKYQDRTFFESLPPGLNMAGDEEVLYHVSGRILEARYANIIWKATGDNHTSLFTPPDPLHQGTARTRLLAENILVCRNLSVDELESCQWLGLINAILDPGEIQIEPRAIRLFTQD